MKKRYVLYWTLLFGCFALVEAFAFEARGPIIWDEQSPAQEPTQTTGLEKIADLVPSFYWVAVEKPADDQLKIKTLRDMNGNVLARVTSHYFDQILMEGTGKLLDGRVLNFAGKAVDKDGNSEMRFLVCGPDAPYGYGVNGYILQPFRSVAIDPRIVPMGARLFIPEAKGTILPDGSIHDGFFQAIDIGDRIQNRRIDMFTAYGDQSAVFYRHGVMDKKPVSVYLVH